MDRDQAISAFMGRIVSRAFNGAIGITTELLEEGPIGKKSSQDESDLHNWYTTLDANNKEMVKRTIKQTAFSSLFGCLVVLDNSYTGYALKDAVSDFALYVRQFNSSEDYLANRIDDEVRINNNLPDLHDLLLEYIEVQDNGV